MKTTISKVINSFSNFKVLVIGEGILDVFLKGKAERLCREGPVPIVDISEQIEVPGGAANTALNVAELGAETYFLSIVGDDHEGYSLLRELKRNNINVDKTLFSKSATTMTKNRIVADGQLLNRFDKGENKLDPEVKKQFIKNLSNIFSQVDTIIVSDYGYGIIFEEAIEALSSLQKTYKKILVVDSKNVPLISGITAVKPNYEQALAWVGEQKLNQNRLRQSKELVSAILAKVDTKICALTLDQDGALIGEGGKGFYRTYAETVDRPNTVGAGDTYTSALALSLTSQVSTQTAAEIASAASQITVHKELTSTANIEELANFFASTSKKISSEKLLFAIVENYQKLGKKIVFTNGCFDILHSGHISYLNQAKELGDILLIGVNSDESVRRLKGPERPINTLEDRLEVLAALSSVDHTIPFSESTPLKLIRKIRPDIYVKGGDYTIEELPEANLMDRFGGQVKILPYLADHSTSGIIERIREYRKKEKEVYVP